MQCTSCHKGQLQPAYLDTLFPCHSCTHCGGNLILLSDYLRWKANAPEQEQVAIEIDTSDTQRAMLCPKTGSLMLKYRISHKTERKLDLSPLINAIWLDKGEWELLKSEGLTLSLNAIFTEQWQKNIRAHKTKDTLSAHYQMVFGDDYATLAQFKLQLDKMKNKPEAIPYLLADAPYSV